MADRRNLTSRRFGIRCLYAWVIVGGAIGWAFIVLPVIRAIAGG